MKPTFVDETAPRLRSRLSVEEREEIQDGVARGESIRSMARRLDRAPSTVMREINRNGSYRGPGRYRARYRVGARWRGGWDPTPRYRASQAPARAWRNARQAAHWSRTQPPAKSCQFSDRRLFRAVPSLEKPAGPHFL